MKPKASNIGLGGGVLRIKVSFNFYIQIITQSPTFGNAS